jgi:hypothetical protein
LLVEIGDLEAAKLFHDLGDAAGAHTLDMHGGDGRFEGAITARSPLQKRVAENRVAFADLRDRQFQSADSGLKGAFLSNMAAFMRISAILSE